MLIQDTKKQKRLGQYFTPEPIAKALATWVLDGKPREILDPALGTGILVDQLLSQDETCSITGVEIDPELATWCRKKYKTSGRIEIIQDDFLYCKFDRTFDAVLANPPYIRHHLLERKDNLHAHLEKLGILLPKTTNSFVMFVMVCLQLLKPGGRAAFIVPSDWLNANYGLAFKRFIKANKSLKRLVIFKHTNAVFGDNLSTGSLLFFHNDGTDTPLEVLPLDETIAKTAWAHLGDTELPDELAQKVMLTDLDQWPASSKWLARLTESSIVMTQTMISLGSITTPRRGIATGANTYFVKSLKDLSGLKISTSHTRICITRAQDVKGLVFTSQDLDQLESTLSRTRLLDLDPVHAADRAYVAKGLAMELPSRYLLSKRQPWYKQETRKPSQIWASVFGREGLTYILNQASACNLTTFHCLYSELSNEENKILVGFLNTPQLQRINRTHERAYGNGLQKVEPRDLEEMLIPDPRAIPTAFSSAWLTAVDTADEQKRNSHKQWRVVLAQCWEQTLNSHEEWPKQPLLPMAEIEYGLPSA